MKGHEKDSIMTRWPLPPLPEWSLRDDLGGLVPSQIRSELAKYANAAVAMREADKRTAVAWRYRFHTDDSLAGKPNVRTWMLTHQRLETTNEELEVEALCVMSKETR